MTPLNRDAPTQAAASSATGAGKPAWLFVLPWSLDAIGGVSEVVRNLMSQADHEGRFLPRLLVNQWSDPLDTSPNRDRAGKAVDLNMREPSARLFHVDANLRFLIALIPTLLRLRKYLKEYGVQVVNVHYPHGPTLYFAIARRLGWIDALIVSFHGADVTTISKELPLRAGVMRWTMNQADSLVACSNALLERTVSLFRPDMSRCTTIYNGVDFEQCRKEIEQSAHVDEDGDYILCVATFEHKKGIDLLIAAFEQVGLRHGGCRLVVVGRTTPYFAHLESQLTDLRSRHPGVGARVEFITGESHGRVLRRMQNARIVVLPSRLEAFPLVVMEAGFAGTPLVASRAGGVPEIIEHDVNGLLVSIESVTELVDAIDLLLRDGERSSRLADALRRRVAAEFSWARAWSRYVASADAAGSVDR